MCVCDNMGFQERVCVGKRLFEMYIDSAFCPVFFFFFFTLEKLHFAHGED